MKEKTDQLQNSKLCSWNDKSNPAAAALLKLIAKDLVEKHLREVAVENNPESERERARAAA